MVEVGDLPDVFILAMNADSERTLQLELTQEQSYNVIYVVEAEFASGLRKWSQPIYAEVRDHRELSL